MHDLRGGITNCELGTNILRPTTSTRAVSPSHASFVAKISSSASSSSWSPAARSVERALFQQIAGKPNCNGGCPGNRT